MRKAGKLPTFGVRVSRTILVGIGVSCVCALLYVSYYYAWSGQRHFTSHQGVVFYFAVPAILTILSFVALRSSAEHQVRLATAFLLMALSISSVESFLTFVDSGIDAFQQTPLLSIPMDKRKKVAAKLAKEFGREIDIRDEDEVINDLREQGIDAVRQISLSLPMKQADNGMTAVLNIDGVEFMPLGGIANKVTVACNQSGQPLIYETDERGLHNPKGVWQLGSIEIAAVGNSSTMGYCVSSDSNFVALIRRHYPATLNLGMPGAGPMHILATLEEYASLKKPKLVLWFYSDASFAELQSEKQSRILWGYLKTNFTQPLLQSQSDIDKALRDASDSLIRGSITGRTGTERQGDNVFHKLPAFIKLSTMRQKFGLIYGAERPQVTELTQMELSKLQPDLALLREILTRANAQVTAWGGKMFFVYLPGWEELYARNPQPAVRARPQILTLVHSLGIPIIDADSAFHDHPDPWSLFPLRRPGHYSEKGHRLIAESVLNALSQMSW